MAKKIVGFIGLSSYGLETARTLTALGHSVVALDIDHEKVRRVSQELDAVYSGDATDKKVLDQLRFHDFDIVIVSVGPSMEASILVSLNLIDLKAKLIIVKSASPEQTLVLKRLGITHVVQPEIEIGRQTAHKINNPGLLDFLSLGGGTLLKEVRVKHWAGQTLTSLELPSMHGAIAVAKKSSTDKDFHFVPDPRIPLEEGDMLLLIGPVAKISKLEP